MSEPAEDVTLETIERLSARLERVEYALTGGTSRHGALATPSSTSGAAGRTVAESLSQLERRLERMSASSRTIQELLRLCKDDPTLEAGRVSLYTVYHTNSILQGRRADNAPFPQMTATQIGFCPPHQTAFPVC
jgi:hypothetical protein